MLLEIIFFWILTPSMFNGSKFQWDFLVLIRPTEFKKEKILFWFLFLALSRKMWKISKCFPEKYQQEASDVQQETLKKS